MTTFCSVLLHKKSADLKKKTNKVPVLLKEGS